MKFYIASKFENYKQVLEVEAHARACGHSITFSWAASAAIDVLEKGKEVTTDYLQTCGNMDINGVKSCHALVYINNPEFQGMYSSLIEVGMALAVNKEVWLVGEMPDTCPFYYQPRVKRFSTPQAAMVEMGKRL